MDDSTVYGVERHLYLLPLWAMSCRWDRTFRMGAKYLHVSNQPASQCPVQREKVGRTSSALESVAYAVGFRAVMFEPYSGFPSLRMLFFFCSCLSIPPFFPPSPTALAVNISALLTDFFSQVYTGESTPSPTMWVPTFGRRQTCSITTWMLPRYDKLL